MSDGATTGYQIFQPTPSLRRATGCEVVRNVEGVHISTHALLAEGDSVLCDKHGATDAISTHALLAEGDAQSVLDRPWP